MVADDGESHSVVPELVALRALEDDVSRLRWVYEDRQRHQEQWRQGIELEAKLAEALSRVSVLENELRELRVTREQEQKTELERLRQEIGSLRAHARRSVGVESAHRPDEPSVAGERGRTSARARFSVYPPTVPAYLVHGYAEITSLLSTADASDELGQRTEALQTRFLAAHNGCELLGKLCDDEEYHALLKAVTALAAEHDQDVRELIADDDSFEQVRTPSLQLLVLGGLSSQDAADLLDACRADFLAVQGQTWRRPAVIRRNLRRLRNAICGETKDSLRRNVQRSRRRDQAIPTLIKGVGGGVLAGVAGPLAALVGTVPAAALGAIGAAAVETAAARVTS
jgi:hypothetical protein